MKKSAWYLYILLCKGERLYTGITTDIDVRFADHKSGRGAKFTRSFPPVRILYQQEFASRSEASKAERAIKKLPAAEKRKLIRNPPKTPDT